ncbi:MAG: hypothetical protein LBK46_09480 [Oscillospiraceae bacterium]|jgi:hypothetical protein|nr:hypothetical protein [Oscillospiraceae bacterium]
MANAIELFKKYVPILDEVYKLSSLTGVLDGAPELAREGMQANELVIPIMDMSGLANYDRNNGYAAGDVTITHETKVCNYDRGRMFQVDSLDDAETAGIAFGRLAGEFIRTKVVPELDAFRLSAYAGYTGVTVEAASLMTGEDVVGALRAAANAMDDAEAPATERYLFILPSLYGAIQDMDTTSSRAVLDRFAAIIQVPSGRMNTEVTLTSNGFTADGETIHFIAIHKPAVIQYQKHIAPKVITPEQNQNADAWKFGYRNVGIAEVYKSKLKGIYVHTEEPIG